MTDEEEVWRGLEMLSARLQEQQRLLDRILPEVEQTLTRRSLTPSEFAQIQRLAREYREEEDRRHRQQEMWRLFEEATTP